MVRNSIDFQIDNQTGFDLIGDKTWAKYGDFGGDAHTISSGQKGSGEKVTASHAPLTGSAGIIGYSAKLGTDSIYLRLAASNPYMSAEQNSTFVKIDTDWCGYEARYNEMYGNQQPEATRSFAGKTLKVTSTIATEDYATATFTVTWK